MRKTVAVVVMLVCVAVFGLRASDDPVVDQAAIEKAVVQANHRMNASGTDVDQFFADILDFDNGMIIQNGVVFKTRQEAYEAVKRGFQGVARVQRDYDKTHVKVLSSRHALLTGAGTARIVFDNGQTLNAPFAVSVVYQLVDGDWKLLHGHYSTPM